MTIIKTKEFTLRPINLSDLEGYWETMQDKETAKGFTSVPRSKEEAREEIKDYLRKMSEGLTEVFTIEVDGNYAGNVRLDRQDWNPKSNEGRVHLWIHPTFRGKGIATNAMKKLIDYAFKIKKDVVLYAQCKATNAAVIRINQQLGFKRKETRLVDGVEKIWWELSRWH
jgi:RimJ/RimL family protein N-acetyltransferase